MDVKWFDRRVYKLTTVYFAHTIYFHLLCAWQIFIE